MPDAWRALWAGSVRDELRQMLDLLADRPRPRTSRLPGLQLALHARYSLDEIMALLDERNRKGGVMRIQSGVYRSRQHGLDLLLVTLEKSEKDFSPTTLYQDYALSPTRFHWETQSAAHEATPAGRRYQGAAPGAADRVILLVRQRLTDARGVTEPYVCLGPVFHESHSGARPMQVVWRLETPMPASFFRAAKVAAG
jgi:hypothetical protein